MQPLIIQVKVKPKSRVSTLEQVEAGTWLARVKAAPIDGKANEELIALVDQRTRKIEIVFPRWGSSK